MTEQKSLGEQNYEHFADQYAARVDTKGHNAYYERPATLALIPDVAGKRVLDAGCGPGFYTEWLLAHGATHTTAIDVTPRMVELTRQRNPQAEVRQANLEQPLDFLADGVMDMVVCALALDYVRDWGATFAEFYRVLRMPGVLIFSATHPASDFFIYHPQGNYFEVEQVEMLWQGFGEPALVKSYRRSLSNALNALTEAGFRLDRFVEPKPIEKMAEVEPESYDKLLQRPGFICVRALK